MFILISQTGFNTINQVLRKKVSVNYVIVPHDVLPSDMIIYRCKESVASLSRIRTQQ